MADKQEQQQPNFQFDIYYHDSKVGYMKDGTIYSKDKMLNRLIGIFEAKGVPNIQQDGKKLIIKYSKDGKDFWEFLSRSGISIVRKRMVQQNAESN